MSVFAILLLAIILAAFIGVLFALMFSYYFLLKRISLQFPHYYLTLGSPFLPTASWAITKTIGRDGSNYLLLARLLKGVPHDFPKDVQLKRLALYIRLEIIVTVALVAVGISLAIIS